MANNLKEIIAKVEKREPLTHEEKKKYIAEYAITRNHTRKMFGMVSISTSCLCNTFCMARRKHDPEKSICPHCYSAAQLSKRKTNAVKFMRNYVFFTTYELTEEDIPVINATYFRFEAFGDVQNLLQVKNYYLIKRVNAKTIKHAAIWSKNPALIQAAGAKPKNLIYVYSNERIDKPITMADFEMLKKEFPVIDKVFSVFHKSFAEKEGVKINCGGRECISCMRCYHNRKEDRIVNELLK